MALHAVDDLSDAYSATRSFLLPLEWGRWLRLALLSLFVASSGGSTPSVNFQTPLGGFDTPGGGMPTDIDVGLDQLGAALSENLALILLLVGGAVLIGILMQWLAAIFEFAFLEALRTDEVWIREYTRLMTGPGTRLFVFRLLYGLAALLVVGGVFLLVAGPYLLGVPSGTPWLLLLLALPVLFVLGIVGSIVYVFTTAFVAPIMLLEDRSLLSAWARFWGVFKRDWVDFLVYALVGLFLMIAIGIGVGLVMAVIGIGLAVPVVVALLVAGPIAAGLLAIPAGLLGLLAWGLVQVPVQTYLRHWSLLVLGDVAPNLDLIPERRAAIRGESTT